jgi:predicted nicotinamide N-methyase
MLARVKCGAESRVERAGTGVTNGTGLAGPAFIRAVTRLAPVPLAPEIRLYLAAEPIGLWQRTEQELGRTGLPPPYWAFAWAGGQALARFLLDAPGQVAGKRVLDLGSGSGLSAIAAALADAAFVLAADIDQIALAAVALNAAANGVAIETTADDLLAVQPAPFDVVLVGDLFYERQLSDRVQAFIDKAALAGALVLIGDPQRNYFPKGLFEVAAVYAVPVTRELEDAEIKRTSVWRLPGPCS